MNERELPPLSSADWQRLEVLRAGYLEGAALPWHDERDLVLYDRSFGARIGWKWRAVLAEPAVARLEPDPGPVVDFGCGSGVASVALHASGLVTADAEWFALDHSPLAWSFTRARLERRGAKISNTSHAPEGEIGTLVASHVLTELDPDGLDALVALARRARRAIFVEPGSKAASRELVRLRESLVDDLVPIAPCPHAGACGLAGSHDANLWCHHFAAPAPDVFTTAFWRDFSEHLGVDLRALPFSFLVFERSAAREPSAGVGQPVRVLGRPRWEKGRARVDLCTSRGVIGADLLRRTSAEVHKGLKEPEAAPQSYLVDLEDARITRVHQGPGSTR